MAEYTRRDLIKLIGGTSSAIIFSGCGSDPNKGQHSLPGAGEKGNISSEAQSKLPDKSNIGAIAGNIDPKWLPYSEGYIDQNVDTEFQTTYNLRDNAGKLVYALVERRNSAGKPILDRATIYYPDGKSEEYRRIWNGMEFKDVYGDNFSTNTKDSANREFAQDRLIFLDGELTERLSKAKIDTIAARKARVRSK